MIECELCNKKIRIMPEIAPPDYKFELVKGWAFCHDCKIKLLTGVKHE